MLKVIIADLEHNKNKRLAKLTLVRNKNSACDTTLCFMPLKTAYRHFRRASRRDLIRQLMRHPSLLDFLIEAAKTFRTRRKKLISVDQNMSVFVDNKSRLVFENSPIRVIFSRRQGMHVFHDDPAFQHLNEQHRSIIANLPRFHYLLDIQDEGLFYIYNRPSLGEIARFRTT